MKNIGDIRLTKKEENLLFDNFTKKLKDLDFKEVVSKLDIKDEILFNYTTRLEECSKECSNCKNCKGLSECKNTVKGHILTPKVVNNRIDFSYQECKYQEVENKNNKYKENIYLFEVPKMVREASLKDFYKNDKNRIEFLKYVKTFIDEYKNKKDVKGIYLHGSYGTGKTYMVAALFNELAKNNVKSTIVYVPEFLRLLKSSFDDYEDIYETVKRTPLLLLDDIGAEYLTPWARDEILGTILQYRMSEKLPTFFTSNLDINELEKHFSTTPAGIEEIKGRRITERIKDLTKDFCLVSESNRK